MFFVVVCQWPLKHTKQCRICVRVCVSLSLSLALTLVVETVASVDWIDFRNQMPNLGLTTHSNGTNDGQPNMFIVFVFFFAVCVGGVARTASIGGVRTGLACRTRLFFYSALLLLFLRFFYVVQMKM